MNLFFRALLVSVIVFGMFYVPSVQAYSYDEGCTFSVNDYETLDTVVAMFDKHAEEKIIYRLFSTEEFQQVARALTQEFTEGLASTENDCTDGTRYPEYTSMRDVTMGLVEYVEMIKVLKTEEQSQPSNDVVGQQSLILQNILYDTLIQDPDGFKSYMMNMIVGIDAVQEDMPISMNFSINAEGIGNNAGTMNDGSIQVGGTIEGTNDQGEAQSVTVGVDAQMRIVDETLYLNVKDVTTSGMLDESAQEEFDQMMTALSLVEGKWIAMPFSSSLYGSMAFGSNELFSLFDTAKSMTTVPVFTTYYVEGSTYYGGLNPTFCAYIEGSVAECLMTWIEGKERSYGKGYVMMQGGKESYSLGFTDKFFDESEQLVENEEGAFLMNTPLLWWNDTEITRFELPENDFVNGSYQNNKIHLSAEIPQYDFDYETGAMTETEGVSILLNGTIVDGTYDITMTMSFPEKFMLTMELDGFEKPTKARTITVPSSDDIITIDQLGGLFGGAMIDEY